MKINKDIPAVSLTNIQDKSFGFKIASNREILFHKNLDHDPFRPHRIHFYAILFILEGEGQHFVDFKSYPYKKGSLIFISKEQVHAFEKNWEREASFLLFTEDFLEKGNIGSNLMQQLSLYNYHRFPPVVQLGEEQMKLFLYLTKKMHLEFDQTDDALTEEILHASLKIFLCLAERIRKENRKSLYNAKYQEEYQIFQILLNQYIFETRKVKDYADKMHISTKKLNRVTQEIIGQTAKTHINEVLILEIKRFLMNTSLSISEIGYKTGFEETTNFVKYFKKYTDFRPSEFRAQF